MWTLLQMKEWNLNPGFLFVREAIPPIKQKQNLSINTGDCVGQWYHVPAFVEHSAEFAVETDEIKQWFNIQPFLGL